MNTVLEENARTNEGVYLLWLADDYSTLPSDEYDGEAIGTRANVPSTWCSKFIGKSVDDCLAHLQKIPDGECTVDDSIFAVLDQNIEHGILTLCHFWDEGDVAADRQVRQEEYESEIDSDDDEATKERLRDHYFGDCLELGIQSLSIAEDVAAKYMSIKHEDQWRADLQNGFATGLSVKSLDGTQWYKDALGRAGLGGTPMRPK